MIKRRDLVRHLAKHGCFVHRQGGAHEIWKSPDGRRSPVARHSEIPLTTARNVCKLLGVPPVA